MIKRFLKFSLVGFTGVFVNMAVFTLCQQLGLHYVMAAALAFFVAASSNFCLNSVWTFRDRPAESGGNNRRYLKFLFISLVCLAGNLAILVVLVERFLLPQFYAQLVAVLFMSVVNFVGQNVFTFIGVKDDKRVSML